MIVQQSNFNFIKGNLFQILALIFGIVGLYSMTQTLPLQYRANINALAINANSEDIKELQQKKAEKEVIEIQLIQIQKDINDIKAQNANIFDLLTNR